MIHNVWQPITFILLIIVVLNMVMIIITLLVDRIHICLQVKYCSEECRQAAWDQHHRTLCLGENHGDPDHPLEKLQEAWRFLFDFVLIVKKFVQWFSIYA